jgi:predicted phage terminase large subunit-like protein
VGAAALSLVPQADFDRDAIRRRGFPEFVRRAWPQVDTSPLSWNWHIEAIAEHLEAVRLRQIRDLVINIPPGCSKSLLVSVLWPAYVWTLDPAHRWITASYDQDLALRDSRKHRTLVESDWYRARWDVELPKDRSSSTAVSLWFNTRGGMRNAVTVRGAVTGKHGDTAVIDDPIDTTGASAASGKELDEVIRWWRETMPMRFRSPTTSTRVLVMQRLHEKDLSAEMKRLGATILCLPMRYESKHPNVWKGNPAAPEGSRRRTGDPRTVEGELLHSERYPEEVVRRLEIVLGTQGTASQLQQRPAPAEGGVFKEAWFQFWTELPPGGVFWISVDCAFKETNTSSYVVFQVWYLLGPNFYLVDQVRDRMDFTRTLSTFKSVVGQYPRAFRKLVEAKANGPAVMNVLKAEVPGLEAIEPEGGKEARANAVQPLVESRNVFVPHPENARYSTVNKDDGRVGAPWVRTVFFPEVTVFPNAAQNDQVDTMTQLLNRAAPRAAERFRRAIDGAMGRQ